MTVPTEHRLAYSPAELAEALGCSRQHIHNLIVRGEIRSIKIGASRRISAAEVTRLLGEDTGQS